MSMRIFFAALEYSPVGGAVGPRQLSLVGAHAALQDRPRASTPARAPASRPPLRWRASRRGSARAAGRAIARCFPGVSFCRCLSSGLVSRMKYANGKFLQAPSRASAPEPAPNSSTASPGCSNSRDLARERAPEQGRELRRGDEIAARAELARAAGVVAEAGLVQRELHVAREGNPVAGGASSAPMRSSSARLAASACGSGEGSSVGCMAGLRGI